MRAANRFLVAYLSLLILLAVCLAAAGSSTATRSGTQLARTTQRADLADLLGTWSGTWNDTIYSVGGSLSFQITENAGVYAATGDIGLQSLALGIESGSASGSVQGGSLDFTFSSATVGSGLGSIDATTGAASGSGSVIGSIGFGAFVFQGSASGDVISGIFDFTSPTGGAGVATLTRTATTVEEVPWSEVKRRYRNATAQNP